MIHRKLNTKPIALAAVLATVASTTALAAEKPEAPKDETVRALTRLFESEEAKERRAAKAAQATKERREKEGPVGEAKLLPSGEALAPSDAPPEVKRAIAAANEIRTAPYLYGGGHASFESSGYDCSGAISYALHGGGFLDSPLSSSSDLIGSWGESGEGEWITTYGHGGHAYIVIAGLRFDTSGTDSSGPRWHESLTSEAGGSYVASHPKGF